MHKYLAYNLELLKFILIFVYPNWEISSRISNIKIILMTILCIVLSAIIIALSLVCYRLYKWAHKLFYKNRRLELEIEKADLINTGASAEAIKEVTMAIIDFDKVHYEELYR